MMTVNPHSVFLPLFTIALNVTKFYSKQHERDDRRRDPANGHCQTAELRSPGGDSAATSAGSSATVAGAVRHRMTTREDGHLCERKVRQQ